MRSVLLATSALVVTSALIVGCGAAAPTGVKVSEAERARATLTGRDAQLLAPQAFAEADQALLAAREAARSRDDLAVELHAERAVAAYQHAVALARLTRATDEEGRAKDALSRAVEQSERHATARKGAERDVDDLEKRLKIAREAERPAPAGNADPERERARLVAAEALATQARLLCSAARLVSPRAPGLAEAEATVIDLGKKLASSPKPAPIDLAGKARATCLEVLTKARRAGGLDDAPDDALLGELSRARVSQASASGTSASASTDLTPSRDERGVVVTLRSVFKADGLSTDAETTLKELGRVAGAHPGFAIQVVLHDAAAPSATESAQNDKRGAAVAKALVDGGASAAKTKVEQAGARAPVFDPTDPKRRGANARVEIVFVGGA